MKPYDGITEFVFYETELRDSDIILIPGGSYPEQMIKAAEIFHMEKAPYILPSGGMNSRLIEMGYETEFDYMKDIAIKNGVPEEVILKENKARNTFDNARNSWDVLQKSNMQISRAILVCKAHHARRALMTYQTVFPLNIKFYIATVENRGINKENWYKDEEKINRVMSEVEKIGKYFGNHIAVWTNKIDK